MTMPWDKKGEDLDKWIGDTLSFRRDGEELFKKANLDPAHHQQLFKRTCEILGETEARNSVLMGLTWKRVRAFDSQKKSLLKELKAFAKREQKK